MEMAYPLGGNTTVYMKTPRNPFVLIEISYGFCKSVLFLGGPQEREWQIMKLEFCHRSTSFRQPRLCKTL